MFNLIRMNLFRLIHTKGVIVVFCLLMGFAALGSFESVYDKKQMQDIIDGKTGLEGRKPEEGITEEDGDNPIGIYIDTPESTDRHLMDYIYMYCEEISSGIVLVFILIGAVIFFRGDERDGFLKNIAGQTKHRYNILISKLAVIAVYIFVCMACYMVAGFVTYKAGWLIGVKINLGLDYIPEVFNITFGVKHIPEALEFFALEYILYMAFTGGILLITEVTKSTATAITIGLLGILGFGIFFSALVRKVFSTDFDISKYYISTNISNLDLGMDRDIVILALCIGIVFFIIYNVLNVLWFSRKDIV